MSQQTNIGEMVPQKSVSGMVLESTHNTKLKNSPK